VTADEARSEISLPPLADAVPQEPVAAESAEVPPEARALARRLLERKRDGEALPTLFETMVELAAPALEADVERFLDGQRRRVKRAVAGG
jgi:hypothetical protein